MGAMPEGCYKQMIDIKEGVIMRLHFFLLFKLSLIIIEKKTDEIFVCTPAGTRMCAMHSTWKCALHLEVWDLLHLKCLLYTLYYISHYL